MRSGATSARSFADVAISSAYGRPGRAAPNPQPGIIAPHGRKRPLPLPCNAGARDMYAEGPGGAKWLNCGSVMLLTDGMIMPMRARGAWSRQSYHEGANLSHEVAAIV